MAAYQCTACGNLHGAPVEGCGLCGGPVVPYNEATGEPATSPNASPPPTEPDRVLAALLPFVAPFFKLLTERNERQAELDRAHTLHLEEESARSAELHTAAMTLLASITALVATITNKVQIYGTDDAKSDTVPPPSVIG